MKSMNLGQRSLLALAVCALPLSGFAAEANDELSYGYVELDYINLDVDQPGERNVFDGDFDNGGGYGISASVPLNEMWFLFGDYTDTDSDFGFTDNTGRFFPGNIDIKRLNLGAGVAMPMNDRSDLVISGAYADLDYGDFNFGAAGGTNSIDDITGDSSDGYMADVRWRSQWTQAVEGSLGARYTDIGNTDGLSFIGSVLFELNPNWGINLQVDAGDELITYGAGVRMTF